MASISVDFTVKAACAPGEIVCVVGSCPELGNWAVEKAKPLALTTIVDRDKTWTRSIRLSLTSPEQEVQYRYVICHMRETEHEGDDGDVIVRQWETNRAPRKFSLFNAMAGRSHQNGTTNGNGTEVDTFGEYGHECNVDKGWLTGQMEIHFRLHSNPIRMWKHSHHKQTYRIKCTPIDLNNKDLTLDEDSSHDLPEASNTNRVLVSVLNGEADLPSEQQQFGTLYTPDSYMVFRSQFFDMESIGYQFDFFVHDPNAGATDICKYVGHAFLLPLSLQDSIGLKSLPITGLKHKPIGQLNVDYLMVRPLAGVQADCSCSFSRHWKRQRGTLDVGHRGMGSSYGAPPTQNSMKRCEAVRENTIASLSEAGGHGADFVEFDVQLSKDNIPVVYHDFVVSLSMRKKNSNELEWFDIPVHELNLEQLQMLQVDHVSEKSKGSPHTSGTLAQEDPEGEHRFPTLRECFEKLDQEIGFNIEIKYCMRLKSGKLEDNIKHYMERNQYVDFILKEILEHAGARRIVLSCFDPDICTMVRLKQNHYPIIFLSQGNTVRYPAFQDQRAANMPLSCRFGHSEVLLGVNLHTEDLIKDADLIRECKAMGLVVFCWGEDNNSKDIIQHMKQMNVDGIIYDRIHELKSANKVNIFKMEKEAKLALLRGVGCISTQNSAHSTSANGQSNGSNYTLGNGQSTSSNGHNSGCDSAQGSAHSTSANEQNDATNG